MWQTGLCPMDTTELWSQPKYQISWLNNLCFVFFWAALLLPEGAMPWAGGGERLEGQYEGQEGFLCACSGSYSLPWTFTVAGARDGHDPVSLFLDSSSCGSSIFYSKNYENSGVYAVPLSVKSEALVSVWLTTLPSVAGYVLKIWPEVQNHHFFSVKICSVGQQSRLNLHSGHLLAQHISAAIGKHLPIGNHLFFSPDPPTSSEQWASGRKSKDQKTNSYQRKKCHMFIDFHWAMAVRAHFQTCL